MQSEMKQEHAKILVSISIHPIKEIEALKELTELVMSKSSKIVIDVGL